MSNTNEDPKGIELSKKVPNTNIGPLRINETEEGKNNPVQNLMTITEVSSTEVRTEIKDDSSPYCKRKTNPHQVACDKPMQTDK